MLLGKDAINRLSMAHVIVFGIGGVGSYTVEGLIRGGIGRVTLVDHDIVSTTNINRQLIATTESVGCAKVDVMKKRILTINPEAIVETMNVCYLPEEADRFFSVKYDYIVDAVDMVTAKVDLVVQAKKYGIPIISCMGTGNKINPLSFEVSDIFKTSVCPLARVIRRELKLRQIDSLKVVYSKELPLHNENSKTDDNRRVPGSVSFVPSVAGLIIAGEVIKDIIGVSNK